MALAPLTERLSRRSVPATDALTLADLKRLTEGLSYGDASREVAKLARAADPDRDQSYFLFATTREQLDFLRFPLGGMKKPDVRRAASALLPSAKRRR